MASNLTLLQGGVGLAFGFLTGTLLVVGLLLVATLLALGAKRLRGHLLIPAVVATVLVSVVAFVEVFQDLGVGRSLGQALPAALFGRLFTDIDRLPALAFWPILFAVFAWIDVAGAWIDEAIRRRRNRTPPPR